MRLPLALAAILLAGCATVDPPEAPPPTITPALPTGQPQPRHVETQDGWKIEFEDARYTENYGNPANVSFVLRADGDLVDGVRIAIAPEWAILHGDPRVGTTPQRFTATAFIGHDERFGVTVYAGDEVAARFRGPPLLVADAGSAIETRQETDVSDDAPGLSAIVTAPGHVRITYAPPRNATSTADERVLAVGEFHLQLGHFQPAGFVTGFVTRYTNDAIAPLATPERARVVAEADVPSGPLTIQVVSKRTCFCGPQPPEVEVITLDMP